MTDDTVASPAGYDAVLFVSFGGPEGEDDVLPFLENVTAGRDVPRERLLEVGEHYFAFDGVSPINEHNRRIIAALETELDAHGPKLPVYWGNRNWHPLLEDTLARMADDGVRRAIAFVTSAYSSYSGCRQYREDLARARAPLGDRAPEIDKLRVFYNHPGFVEPQADRVAEAVAELDADDPRIVFVAHSIPRTMARHSEYEAQLRDTCELVTDRLVGQGVLGDGGFDLVWSSRSGPPSVPWLEPDVNDHLETLAGHGERGVVLVPVGFVSDHMEVVYDLDVEARETADRLGLRMARAGTAGDDPRFAAMIRELVAERVDPAAPRHACGLRGASHDECPIDCCLVPGQEPQPTVATAAPTARRHGAGPKG